ncbi:MAG: Rab family GTPase [Promethearchaeota archaeon]
MAAGNVEKYKVLVVGDPMVGKTSLIRKYTEDKFQEDYIPTIGVNLCKHTLRLSDREVVLIFWDIAGHQSYEKMRGGYFQGAAGVVYVFDVTDEATLENVSNWKKSCEKYGVAGCPSLLVGNKVDLLDQRVVPSTEGAALAKEMGGLPYFETSALTGQNVHAMFETIYGLMEEEG